MTAIYGRYVWHEPTPGIWIRDIDEAEQVYTSLIRYSSGTGKMHFAITGHLSLAIATQANESLKAAATRLDQALRTAWLSLRDKNPTIASRVSYNSALGKWQKVYETVTDKIAQEAWVDDTLKFICNVQTGVEWANSDPPAPRVATLFILKPPSSVEVGGSDSGTIRRDLVLRCPHDIIDGIGTLSLFDNLLSHLFDSLTGNKPVARLLDGNETARLSPPFRVAANVPHTPTPDQLARLEDIESQKQKSAFPDGGETIEHLIVPFRPGPVLPQAHQRVSVTLSPAQTTTLLAAVKPLGATPTHVFHAAIALILRDVHLDSRGLANQNAKIARYTNYILRNERQACMPPFNDPKAHPAAIYHSISSGSLTVDMPITFEEREKNKLFAQILIQMRDYYLSLRDDKEHYSLVPYIWKTATPDVPPPTIVTNESGELEEDTLPPPPPNPKPSVSLSSMGLIDKVITPDRVSRDGKMVLKAYNPWVTGEELGTGLGLFLGTFRGQLEISAAYNSAWHDEVGVEDFLRMCVDAVFGWVDSL
ncbi:hypothetical protein V8F33_004727 [Rhypophila sp. PSN 637]